MATLLFGIAGLAPSEVHEVAMGPLVVPKQEGHFTFTAAWGAAGSGPASRPVLFMGPSFDKFDFCRGFAITVDWSTLFGEPVEDYIVEWTGRDQFTVRDSTGGLVTVTRSMLANYPDLQVLFAALKPKAVHFTVEWAVNRASGLDSKDLDKIDAQARAAYGNVRENRPASFHASTPVTDDSLILVESGKTPFHTQGIRGWDKFLAPETRYSRGSRPTTNSPEQRKLAAAALPRAKALEIHEVVIDRVDWPEAEMRAIADQLRAYREGKEQPTPEEEVKAALAKQTPPYAAKDEWAEAAEKPRPAEPPTRRKDPDGLFSYYYSDGQKAFPARFTVASKFADGIARVSTDTKFRYRFNFIDESGNYLFPEASSGTHRVVSDKYIIAGKNEGTAENPSGVWPQFGLYDRKAARFLIPQTANMIRETYHAGTFAYDYLDRFKDDKEHFWYFRCIFILRDNDAQHPMEKLKWGPPQDSSDYVVSVRYEDFQLDLAKGTVRKIGEFSGVEETGSIFQNLRFLGSSATN